MNVQLVLRSDQEPAHSGKRRVNPTDPQSRKKVDAALRGPRQFTDVAATYDPFKLLELVERHDEAH